MLSIYNPISRSDPDFLDLNYIFWKYVFSKNFIKNLCNEYSSIKKFSKNIKFYFDYIINNLDEINKISKNTFIYPYEEKRSVYYFKLYYFIISIFNNIYKEYHLSLAYGIIFNYNIKNIENFINKEDNFLNIFFNDVFNSNSFFENNCDYIISIHWETELSNVVALANFMKKKLSNIKIIIDLNTVNEQPDFSYWQNNNFIKKYIDDFSNIYYENNLIEKNSSNYFESKFFNKKNINMRLFNTKCFWHKCTFCVINSQHKSDEVTENLNEKAKKRIDDIITNFKKINSLILLSFTDEAIECSILLYFAEEIIKNKINILWMARTRFSEKLTNDNCKLLRNSGLRCLIFGLESANSRITKLMNKRDTDFSKNELDTMIKNCDKNGITPHILFIIGFPSETKKETQETIDFIENNFKNRKYLTYSANVFYVMKGSEIYNNPEKFGISITDNNENEKLSAINFIDNNPGDKYTYKELRLISQKIYSKLYFKESFIDDSRLNDSFQFCDFVNKTGIFYIQKLINTYNPYLNNLNIKKLSDDLLNSKLNLLPVTLIIKKEKLYYHNILTEELMSINKDIKEIFRFFISNFDSEISLKNNIINSLNKFQLKEKRIIKLFEKAIIKLINEFILYRTTSQIKL